MEEIYLIITNEKMGLSKTINVTDYTEEACRKTALAYAVNFDVRVKRVIGC